MRRISVLFSNGIISVSLQAIALGHTEKEGRGTDSNSKSCGCPAWNFSGPKLFSLCKVRALGPLHLLIYLSTRFTLETRVKCSGAADYRAAAVPQYDGRIESVLHIVHVWISFAFLTYALILPRYFRYLT